MYGNISDEVVHNPVEAKELLATMQRSTPTWRTTDDFLRFTKVFKHWHVHSMHPSVSKILRDTGLYQTLFSTRKAALKESDSVLQLFGWKVELKFQPSSKNKWSTSNHEIVLQRKKDHQNWRWSIKNECGNTEFSKWMHKQKLNQKPFANRIVALEGLLQTYQQDNSVWFDFLEK